MSKVSRYLHRAFVSSEPSPPVSQPNTPPAGRQRPTTSTPAAFGNASSSAARPSRAREKIFGIKSPSLEEWSKQVVPGEQRAAAGIRIGAAQNLNKLDHFYGDRNESHVGLRNLGLTELPIKALLKLDAACTVSIDTDKIPKSQLAQLTEAVNKKNYSGPTFEPGPKNAAQKLHAERAAKAQARLDAENERFHAEKGQEKAQREARTSDPRKVQVGSITDSASAVAAVEKLEANGFDHQKLSELKVDIREYSNHGDSNNGDEWFNKKYANIFDKKISEPGQPVHFAKLISHLPNT